MAPVAPSIVFIGFMGAGKTKAVKAAAELGLEPIDTDVEIERELGCSVAEYFEREGEEAFRAREAEIVVALLERASGAAIAAGGGSVLSPEIREALRPHLVVWLDVSAEKAWARVKGKPKRPLASDPERFFALHAERQPLYEEVADVVIPGRRELVRHSIPALLALRGSPEGTRMLVARSDSGDYPVLVGRGLLACAASLGPGRAFCVTDSAVGSLYSGSVGELEAMFRVEPGEGSKTLAEAETILRGLAEAGARRDDHLLALGGGVVGDLAGFCAAVYQRGVPVVQVPTTLVAQVDSAYGGKTGVDLPEAKNLVGAYHQPRAVLTDTSVLETLPAAELRAGYAEVLKTALIAGGALWETVSAAKPGAIPSDDVIEGCIRTKLAVVAEDERDSGRRAVLNLGHTVGHAVEAAGGYARYRHGEAVGLGLLTALQLSGAGSLRDDVEAMLAAAQLPTQLDSAIDVDAVMAALGRDKKATARGVGFVLLCEPGAPQVGQLLDPADVRAAVEELRD